jgi:hypothetical protein
MYVETAATIVRGAKTWQVVCLLEFIVNVDLERKSSIHESGGAYV